MPPSRLHGPKRTPKFSAAAALDLDEGLSLLRAFFEIGDPDQRARVVALAERLAAENRSGKAAHSD